MLFQNKLIQKSENLFQNNFQKSKNLSFNKTTFALRLASGSMIIVASYLTITLFANFVLGVSAIFSLTAIPVLSICIGALLLMTQCGIFIYRHMSDIQSGQNSFFSKNFSVILFTIFIVCSIAMGTSFVMVSAANQLLTRLLYLIIPNVVVSLVTLVGLIKHVNSSSSGNCANHGYVALAPAEKLSTTESTNQNVINLVDQFSQLQDRNPAKQVKEVSRETNDKLNLQQVKSQLNSSVSSNPSNQSIPNTGLSVGHNCKNYSQQVGSGAQVNRGGTGRLQTINTQSDTKSRKVYNALENHQHIPYLPSSLFSKPNAQ